MRGASGRIVAACPVVRSAGPHIGGSLVSGQDGGRRSKWTRDVRPATKGMPRTRLEYVPADHSGTMREFAATQQLSRAESLQESGVSNLEVSTAPIRAQRGVDKTGHSVEPDRNHRRRSVRAYVPRIETTPTPFVVPLFPPRDRYRWRMRPRIRLLGGLTSLDDGDRDRVIEP